VTAYTPPITPRSENSLSGNERRRRDSAWSIIQPVAESEPDIYDKKMRPKMLREAAAANGIALPNLYKLLDRYWRAGKTKNAFLPQYVNCGAKGTPRSSYKKSAAQDTGTKAMGKALTDADRKNFAQAIRRYYLNQDKASLKRAYERLLQDFYSVKVPGTGKLKLLTPEELPSFRQFQYWYSKNRDIVGERKKRDGERSFDLNARATLGKADFGLMGPGAQFQIDATVGDVYLVSQFDRSNLIGRPVLYFVIDAFSRMVTGMSIGLEGPSWAGAMMAIANMAADKVAYCKEYGVDISEDEWPCRHVPAALIGDRGEMESKNADNLVNMLGIRIVNAPPYRADLKGIIEQHFRTINTNSVALLPGSVKPDMAARGGRDYRLDAALDIRQFTQIVIKCVLYYNNHHYMGYFEKGEAMMKDSVEAIPVKLWEWGIRHCSGALRVFPEEQVRLAVMPTAKATVTAKGIRFKGLFYSCDRAIREAWFEKARSSRVWSVPISYDPRDMASLYVWDKDGKAFDACSLLDWNGKNAGKCLDEILYEQQKERLAGQQLKMAETEAKVNLNADIDAIVSEAQAMAKGVPAKSKTARVSCVKENRIQERDAMRAAAQPPTSEATIAIAVPESVEDDDISPTLRMIKRKMEERLNG
ncbi:MAG: Mu transposase C-terminal domain-containing protein, partial [Desulfovibrionaceae bacterium]|nr:Mu transposase C-terminal domain-containing protein [Desulfovibrionaceae bacterium]